MFDLMNLNRVAFQMIDQASRSGHNDTRLSLQSFKLFANVSTTHQVHTVKGLEEVREAADELTNLLSQFAGGRKDQGVAFRVL